MGIFSKSKIGVGDIAKSLLDNTFDDEIISNIKKTNNNTAIPEEQKREVLIFKLFTITISVQKAFSDHVGRNEVLNAVHSSAFAKISRFPYERAEFEKLVNERYGTYYQILHSKKDDFVFSFGKAFVKYLMKNDSKENYLPLVIANASLFERMITIDENFLREVLSKFELVL